MLRFAIVLVGATVALAAQGSFAATAIKNADAIAAQITPTPLLTDTLPDAPAGKSWKLIFHDDFDGPAVDSTKWTHRPDGKRKAGWWSSKAVTQDGNGHLVINATNADGKCVSGNVNTAGTFEHAFGYYVCRVKFQKQPGHWPAFWLTSTGVMHVGDQGRDGTEIDIFEKRYVGNSIETNLHWDGYEQSHKHVGHNSVIPGLSEGWHTSALWWKQDEYIFYIDGKETWRTKAGGVSQVPEYIMLSDEFSPWAGDVSKAKLPDPVLIDYVRVYDLVDHAGK